MAKHETIFDHGVTDEELRRVFGIESKRELAWFREDLEKGHDTSMAYIATLYKARGDRKTAEAYINRIEDPSYRFGIRQALLHPDQLPPPHLASQ